MWPDGLLIRLVMKPWILLTFGSVGKSSFQIAFICCNNKSFSLECFTEFPHPHNWAENLKIISANPSTIQQICTRSVCFVSLISELLNWILKTARFLIDVGRNWFCYSLYIYIYCLNQISSFLYSSICIKKIHATMDRKRPRSSNFVDESS